MLSVQVHPPDAMSALIPAGETGKTEAWVVLEANAGSRICAGLKPRTDEADLRSLSVKTVGNRLAIIHAQSWAGVLIEAGTVHSLGDGIIVFEVQENSDVTFRLYDWDHIDPRTVQDAPIQVEQAMACVNFAQGAIKPTAPTKVSPSPEREPLIDCSISKYGA